MSEKAPLGPIPQNWYDENRERFEAETTVTSEQPKPCEHDLYRFTASEVRCKRCHAGWIDHGRMLPLVSKK